MSEVGTSHLTERARLAVLFAGTAARERGALVGCEHLLYGLLREEEGTGAELLEAFGLGEERVRTVLGERIPDPPGSEAGQPGLEPAAERALERAGVEARWESREYVATEHLLLGVLHEAQGSALRLLLDAGIIEEDVRREVARRRR